MRVYSLLFLLLRLPFLKLCSGIKWLAVSQTTFDVNQPQSCSRLQGLLSSQRQLCSRHPELLPTLVSAAQQVKRICQETFSDMRWNCSSVARGPKYAADLSRGTREAGFLYALTAAGLSHALARSCSSGELSLCSCGLNPGSSTKPGLRWGGCADNLRYGLHMGATFIDTPMNTKSSRLRASILMHLHNSEVGRKALNDALQMVCKCHGISGSCSVRTCWRALHDLKLVAMVLKTKYLSATKVVRRLKGSRMQLVPRDIDIRPIGDSELVYLQSSSDFCSEDAKAGFLGTLHRHCNVTSSSSDGCDMMCCGRGHRFFTEQVVEKCHCRYHWCCYVSCRRCHRTVVKQACN